MAKSIKSAKLSTNSLVATASASSKPASINFTFSSGIGQATASLFRNGVLINMQSISSSGAIGFSDVQSGDVTAINGICTGQAVISVSVPTTPATPKKFKAGLIIGAFLIN
ncbi:MAG: hypothetical protein ABW019_12385 [Chitinophagaceae bacterium]